MYKVIRQLESGGATTISVSHFKVVRSETRSPGQRDELLITSTSDKPQEFKLKSETRQNETNKTVFGIGLKRTSFSVRTTVLGPAFRMRWEPFGKKLKPTKPYVVTLCQIKLNEKKPVKVMDKE
jgi:hypothetical protein